MNKIQNHVKEQKVVLIKRWQKTKSTKRKIFVDFVSSTSILFKALFYSKVVNNWRRSLTETLLLNFLSLLRQNLSMADDDASPLGAEQISEYASLNPHTRSWETPREHVTIKQIVGKGAFGQVAKATAVNLQGRAKKTLVAVKMLKGTESCFTWCLNWLRSLSKLFPFFPYASA